MRHQVLMLSIASCLALPSPAPGRPGDRCVDTWIPLYGAIENLSAEVWSIVEFDDGSGPVLVAGGAFIDVGGEAVNRVAMWNGADWAPLGSGFDGLVRSLAVFDDGSGPALFAGGAFTTADGAPAAGIARWRNGAWGPVGGGVTSAGAPASVYALLSAGDGGGPALYVGGDFLEAGGGVVNRVARWGSQGWSGFGTGCDDVVEALAMHDDGGGPALYAGGKFLHAGAADAVRVAVWNGLEWSGLNGGPGGGTDPQVRALGSVKLGDHNELVVGGSFNAASGNSAQGIASWHHGSWSAAPWSGLGNGAAVHALVAPESEPGTVYACGNFGKVAKHTSGWVTVGTNLASQVARSLRWVRTSRGADPLLHVGGNISGADGISIPQIARLVDGAWLPLTAAVNGHIRAFLVDSLTAGSPPSLFAGGRFTSIDGSNCRRVGRWDGEQWTSIGGGVGGGSDPSIEAMVVRHDDPQSSLFIGGRFVTAGSTTVNGIARWDGATWSPLGSGLNLNTLGNEIRALALFDDGGGPSDSPTAPLYAGGAFASIGGVPGSNIARWDGAMWQPVGAGLAASVTALVVHDDGLGAGPCLYAGGTFTSSGETAALRIARWDGALWYPVGDGFNGAVDTLLSIQTPAGPRLFAAGAFTATGSGAPVHHIAVWDGAGWSALGSGIDDGPFVEVRTLCRATVHGVDMLIAGGSFSSVHGLPVSNLAMWDGADWQAIPPGVSDGASPFVATLARFQAPGDDAPSVWVGGSFMTSAKGDIRLARWRPCSEPPPLVGDLNGDNAVNGADLAILLGAWAAAGTAADLNGDGTVDGQDLGILLSAWTG